MKKTILLFPFIALSIFIFSSTIDRAAATELTTTNQFCNFTTTGAGTTGQTSGDVILSKTNYPQGCVIYESINGISSGNLTVDDTTLVLHKILTFDPGQKIDVVNNGRIWINTGGEIEQGKLCVKDVDNDHYAETKTVTIDPNTGLSLSTSVTEIDYAVADSTNICPAGYNLRESMNDLTMVDIDATTNDSSKISTSDRELLRLGFTLAGVTDALAAAGDVQVINKNMLICTGGACPTTNFAPTSGSLYVAGNVGIGLTNPALKLQVASNTQYDGFRLSNTSNVVANIFGSASGMESGTFQLNNTGTTNVQLSAGNGINSFINYGNVGIGITNPSNKLHVLGAGSGATLATSGTTDTTINGRFCRGVVCLDLGIIDNGNSYIQNHNSDTFTTNYPLLLNPNGSYVGIGTTSPINPLSVVSSYSVSQIQFGLNPNAGGYLSSLYDHQFNISAGARYTSASTWEARNANAAIIGSYNGSLYFFTNSGLTVGSGFTPSERMRIDTSGNVGIGITNPSYKLQVAGTLYASGSSRDYKENIKPLEIDSGKIYQLNPVSYDYKPQYKDLGYSLSGGRQIGLIAEDVAKVYPELAITLDRDGVKNKVSNVDYEKLSVLLLAEIKNQKTEIDSLKQQVYSLEQRLIEIESKIK